MRIWPYAQMQKQKKRNDALMNFSEYKVERGSRVAHIAVSTNRYTCKWTDERLITERQTRNLDNDATSITFCFCFLFFVLFSKSTPNIRKYICVCKSVRISFSSLHFWENRTILLDSSNCTNRVTDVGKVLELPWKHKEVQGAEDYTKAVRAYTDMNIYFISDTNTITTV